MSGVSASSRPHVLLVNDDGIEAPGLDTMAEALAPIADLTIVAPRSEQSGMSHALSVFKDLHLERHERDGRLWGWALAGTPVDCVKIALVDLRHERPIDFVVSGINRGQNAGIDILYSGTVAAAREAAILGLPAIAVSLFYRDELHLPFNVAARVGVEVFQMARRHGLPRGVILNVNVPPIPYDQIRGWLVTRMGNAFYEDLFVRAEGDAPPAADPAEEINRPGVRQNVGKGRLPSNPLAEDTDDHALANDCVSITPMHADLTAHPFLPELKTWLGEDRPERFGRGGSA
jgi:5'-nucleotidase